MSESKSASVVFTNGSLLAKNAQNTADSAKTAAETAQDLASGAQKTADGKKSVYRGSDPATVPTAGLKEGDIYFTADTLYTWNGSSWEKTVSDTTGAEIHAKVEAAMQESQKAVADLKSDVEAKVKGLDDEIAQNKIQTGNALSFYKEQYYLSTSYTELAGGSWSDEVPVKTAGKYVWSRYVTANVGDPTNHQYSDPVCISGLDGTQGPQGVPGPKGADGQTTYVHVAYANSADGSANFNVNYFADALYIGVLTDYVQADSTDYTKYTWSRLKGNDGDQGSPGPKGADGQTTYVHFAYANSSDGTANFNVNYFDGALYIGTYTDYTQADSTDFTKYTWSRLKGDTGTDAPTIFVKSYTFSAVWGARADIELTGPNAFKQTVYNRGHNVWVLDAKTHKLKEFVNCDTYSTQSFNHNGISTTVADYLSSLTDSIIVIAAADADSVDQNVRNVLNSMGGSPELGTWGAGRVGHVFIGMSKRSDGTWPLQPRQGYEEIIKEDGSAPEIGCPLSNGGVVANGATGPTGPTGATGPQGPQGDPGSTGFFIGTTPPPNPSKGTVWATTDSSGNMTSAKTWDGSNWVSTAFTQDLVAGNITASKIVGGELDVNKFTVKNAQNIPIESTVSLGQKLSDMKQDADGLTSTVIGGGNLLNNTTDTLQNVTVNRWMYYTTSSDEPIAKHQLDGQTVTLSAWIENPSKEAWVQMWTDKGMFLGSRIPAGEKGWSQVTYTMPSGFGAWNIVVGCGDGSGTVTLSYSSLQLEIGPNRTAWSQSTADISLLKITANSLNAYVRGSNGSSTLASILSMDPNNSTIGQVVNGQVVAAINTSSDGSVKIDGKSLHITADTKIDSATIHAAMIDSVDASTIKAGVLDASLIRVINLDAGSITTGSLSAEVADNLSSFKTYIVSSSNTWDFDYTKSVSGNCFLIGEINADHVYNGPKDDNQNKLTPYMYVTSRGSSDGKNFTVTVWKDNDPTQYQRVWSSSSNSWSNWVKLPNSQNIISTINLNQAGVTISGKNIELDGNTRVVGGFNLIPSDSASQDQRSQNIYRPWVWNNGSIKMQNGVIQTTATDATPGAFYDGANLNSRYVIGTIAPMYLKFTLWNSPSMSTEYARTYIGAEQIETPTLAITNSGTAANIEQGALYVGNFELIGSKIKSQDNGSLYVSNSNGTNFDGNGSVGFQVWSGIGLGKNTIYMPSTDLYIQMGNCGPGLGASYSSSIKVDVHCNRVISQKANTVSSRLSVKTDIAKVTYDRALAAVEGTDMYDYRYVSDDSGQHYVSGIIDDVNADPQYHMDGMLINKERTARIDANLVGYHHVVIQKLLERVAALEEKAK
ncbi:interleukin-like EMT inducer domain-containing protein [Lactobacillus delbrueckii]|uniref:interleukin-like EMT inducer domain-containing protein n=1 Tax=Lactobacillus delbrueckii TaxID=1584 RepID=UPI0025AFF989|nr:interleukin-like EMT inducer domain-containing protein [Lactobacillus delbrueckii]